MYRIRNSLTPVGGSHISFANTIREAARRRRQLVEELASSRYLRRGTDAVLRRSSEGVESGAAAAWRRELWEAATKYDGETEFRLLPWGELLRRLRRVVEVSEVHSSLLAE